MRKYTFLMDIRADRHCPVRSSSYRRMTQFDPDRTVTSVSFRVIEDRTDLRDKKIMPVEHLRELATDRGWPTRCGTRRTSPVPTGLIPRPGVCIDRKKAQTLALIASRRRLNDVPVSIPERASRAALSRLKVLRPLRGTLVVKRVV